jgi:hypothetical protein
MPETGRRRARSPGCGERRGEEDDEEVEVETRERSGERWGAVAYELAK